MKQHSFDTISFVSGLIITLIGLAFLIPYSVGDLVTQLTRVTAWFWPALLLVVGLAVMVPALTPRRKSDEEEIQES